MNKKQLVTVWVGMAVITFFVCYRMYNLCWKIVEWDLVHMDYEVIHDYLLYSWDLPLFIAALAVALTCTFADKKPKDEQKQ
jgi:hypothetical protein